MKKSIFILFALFMASAVSFAQKAPASPKMTAESANVKVTYSAPSKKGREIFGGIVPLGKVWRAGANEATEVTFAKDVDFGGTKVKAGTYSLFVLPEATEWTFILNPTLKQWGAYGYEKIKDADVAKVKVAAKANDNVVEQLKFNVSDASIELMWDNMAAGVSLKW